MNPVAQSGPVGPLTIGRYEVKRKIGSGGMGQVWLCRHPSLGIDVAVKKIIVSTADDLKDIADRFLREARALAKIEHPNVVRIHEVGTDDDGIPFMVLEYMDAGDTEQMAESNGGRLSAERVADIAESMAAALREAQRRHIVHRDIKPANILFSSRGDIKLSDLGLSRCRDELTTNSLTVSGVAVGTPAYIAPEQALRAHDADVRSDIYSLGATLYRLATGTLPFSGENPFETIMKHVEAPLQDPRMRNGALPDGLAEIILRMMEKDPADRYQTPDQLAQDLARFRDGQPIVRPNVQRESPTGQRSNRLAMIKRVAAVLGIIGVVALVAFASYLVIRVRPGQGVTLIPPPGSPSEREPPEPIPAPHPGDAWTMPDTDMAFWYCPAGGFWISCDEVSQGNYVLLMAERIRFAGETQLVLLGAGTSFSPGEPVTGVTFNDAWEFCRRLTLQERDAGRLPPDYCYRLPTEAEWLAGRRFSPPKGPVAGMRSGVWEWCLDPYGDLLESTAASKRDSPLYTGQGRVVRGGAPTTDKNGKAVERRAVKEPQDSVGLRIVLAPMRDGDRVEYGKTAIGNSSYQLFKEDLTWPEADRRCREMGGHLVYVETPEEEELVRRLADGRRVWVGATVEETYRIWRWGDGTLVNLVNWGKGQPQQRNTEYYLQVINSEWHDNLAANSAPWFLCEWDREPKKGGKLRPDLRFVICGAHSPYSVSIGRVGRGIPFLREVSNCFDRSSRWARVEKGEDGIWRLACTYGGWAGAGWLQFAPGTQGYSLEAKSLSGGGKVKLIHKDEGFCLLTGTGGNYAGGGEATRVFIDEDGYWYLWTKTQQRGTWSNALVVRVPGGMGGVTPQEYSWIRGRQAAKMVPFDTGFCFITGIGGCFRGWGEVVHMKVGRDGFWYLGGSSQQSATKCNAMSLPWSALPGIQRVTRPAPPPLHRRFPCAQSPVAAAVSPDVTVVCGVCADGTVLAWDVQDGTEVARFEAVAPSPRSLLLPSAKKCYLVAGKAALLYSLDLASAGKPPPATGVGQEILAWAAGDEDVTVGIGSDQSVFLGGQKSKQWNFAAEDRMTSVAVARLDEQLIAVAFGGVGRPHFGSLRGGEGTIKLDPHEGEIASLKLCVEGGLLFGGTTTRTVYGWDLSDGKIRGAFYCLDHLPRHLDASCDGARLMSYSAVDGRVTVWGFPSRHVLLRIGWATGQPDLSECGKYLFVPSPAGVEMLMIPEPAKSAALQLNGLPPTETGNGTGDQKPGNGAR